MAKRATTDTGEMVYDDLEPKKVKVVLAGKEYVLKEATEAIVVRWRNLQMKSANLKGGKLQSLEGMADREPVLVVLSLFEIKEGREYPVSRSFVDSLRSRIVRDLFEKVVQMSDLEEGEKEPETEEELVEEIASLQDRLDKLRGPSNQSNQESGTSAQPATEAEDVAKNEQPATTDTSA